MAEATAVGLIQLEEGRRWLTGSSHLKVNDNDNKVSPKGEEYFEVNDDFKVTSGQPWSSAPARLQWRCRGERRERSPSDKIFI